MRQGRFTQPRRTVQQDMVERFSPALGGSDSYVQVILDLCLTVEVLETARPQTGIEGRVFCTGFA
jgi:hypothetical protein